MMCFIFLYVKLCAVVARRMSDDENGRHYRFIFGPMLFKQVSFFFPHLKPKHAGYVDAYVSIKYSNELDVFLASCASVTCYVYSVRWFGYNFIGICCQRTFF